MKFTQIAAAVLIFKLLDLCLAEAVVASEHGPLIVYALIGFIVWVGLSLFVWSLFAEIGRLIGPRNG
jgi:hypothetical protein